MNRVRWVTVAAALASLAPIVQAQPAPAPPPTPAPEPPAKLRAKAITRAAAEQWKLGNKQAALGLFQDAYREFPTSGGLLNLAMAERDLGLLVDAADHYRRFLEAPDRDTSRDAPATAALGELRAQLGEIVFDVTTATDEPVQIALDGEAWRELPTRRAVLVMPGTHVVLVRGGGGDRRFEQSVDLAAAGTVTLTIALISEPATPPPPPVAQPIVETPEPGPAQPSTRPGRFGAMVAVAIDPASAGASAQVAVTFAAHPRVQLDLGGLIGGNNAAFVSVTGALTLGALRPTVSIGGVLAFYSWSGADHNSVGMIDRTLVGVRAGAGLEWWATQRLGVLATAAVEYYPSGEPDIHALIVTPTLGVRGRL